MEAGVVLDRFSELGVWERAGVRAPYKPLLLLHALARYQSGGDRLISFSELDERMQGIFRAFGPPRRRYGTNYPFWYLQTDGVWEVESADELRASKGKSREPTRTTLLEAHARGGLAPELYAALQGNPTLLRRVASHLLTAHFPDTLHEEILSAVGLQLAVTRAVRNALFREHVLMAYEYRCAVCGFDARLVDSLIGIEAAHIMWHQAGGPGIPENGIAMCSLHHKLFDRGAFTVTPDHRVEVSQQATGGPATHTYLIGFHAEPLWRPADPAVRPAADYVQWHRRQVFRTPGRPLEPGVLAFHGPPRWITPYRGGTR
jgi:putative restriction endonuclease